MPRESCLGLVPVRMARLLAAIPMVKRRPWAKSCSVILRTRTDWQSLGNNQWAETATSGLALVGTAGSGGLGIMQSSATEDSNVDLTAELVNMITAQRLYQANAQTIKTQDQVLQTLVNLR